MPSAKITSLWALIETMQAKLEKFGLAEEVVDAAVLLGLEALFLGDERRLTGPRPPRPLLGPIIAKA